MFEALAAAIEEVEIGIDSDELVLAHALLDRLAARVTAADGAFDTAELWDESGATSMTRWLVAECAMSDAMALRQSRTAKRLAALPTVASAFEAGELSAGQIELVASWVKPRHVALFREHEAAVVPALVLLDIDATVTVLRDWTTRADAILDGAEPDDHPKRTTVHLNKVLDDYGRLDANLTNDDYAIVVEAFRLARGADDPETDGTKRTRAERDGDALVEL